MNKTIIIISDNESFIGSVSRVLGEGYTYLANPSRDPEDGSLPYAFVIIADGKSSSKVSNYVQYNRILINPEITDTNDKLDNDPVFVYHYDTHCWCLFNNGIGNDLYKRVYFPNVTTIEDTTLSTLLEQQLRPLVKTISQSFIEDENGLWYSNYGKVFECIGENFRGDSIEVKEGCEKIASMAFDKLLVESVKLPSSLKELGEYAFTYCQAKDIEFDVTCPLEIIPHGCFESCYRLTRVNLPAIKRIESDAFSLSSVECIMVNSDSMPVIEKQAFDSEPVRLIYGGKQTLLNSKGEQDDEEFEL